MAAAAYYGNDEDGDESLLPEYFSELPDDVSAQNYTDENTTGPGDGDSLEHEDVMKSTLLRIVFVTLYAIIFVLGVSGNSLVVHVVWRNKSLQTITNIFIANLAASDVMMCLLAVPFTPISGLLSDWIFGKVSLATSASSLREPEM
jgi:hypothetical protein